MSLLSQDLNPLVLQGAEVEWGGGLEYLESTDQKSGFCLEQGQAHSVSTLQFFPRVGSGCVFLVCVSCVYVPSPCTYVTAPWAGLCVSLSLYQHKHVGKPMCTCWGFPQGTHLCSHGF